MDLQEQPEPFATAPALGSADLRPSTNSQMSDSLLRRSLLPRRGADTGMEAEEAVGTRTKKKRTKSGNDLGVSRTWSLTHMWQHAIFDAANAMGIPYLRYSMMHG